MRELNWLHPFSTACEMISLHMWDAVDYWFLCSAPGFSWSQKDMEAVANVSFILASDGMVYGIIILCNNISSCM